MVQGNSKNTVAEGSVPIVTVEAGKRAEGAFSNPTLTTAMGTDEQKCDMGDGKKKLLTASPDEYKVSGDEKQEMSEDDGGSTNGSSMDARGMSTSDDDSSQVGAAQGIREVTFYETTAVTAEQLTSLAKEAVREAAAEAESCAGDFRAALGAILCSPSVETMLLRICRVKIFSVELHKGFSQSNLELLGALKKLKYWYVMPQSSFLQLITTAATVLGVECDALAKFTDSAMRFRPDGALECPRVRELVKALDLSVYLQNEKELETAEPHAVYPTSTYRDCDGHVLATSDDSLIESVMSTTLTTTIKIEAGVLDPESLTLRTVYAPLGRCVCVIDSRVDDLYGKRLDTYYAHHNIQLTKLRFRSMEADKGLETVEKILASLKQQGVGRNEPILIVGGGVISDLGGFAAALYHRNTPYVMLCTSIVSGIDAGPSPRTCCDADGYKNLFGAYHPPVLTLTDRSLFGTLHEGWLRHGIAEIIKMAVVKDIKLFELLEDVGPELIRSKFGTADGTAPELARKCDLIVGKAMHSYVQAEYGNLWETHQCRPHAYGHTWSPGYEIPAGMLHGHAVATGMGWGAFLAMKKGFISRVQLSRVLNLISNMELSLYHPIMDDAKRIYTTQLKIVQKRGGHLCAPVPKGEIGKCGYIQDLTLQEITDCLQEYRQLCAVYPRAGRGIDAHCADVGLEDPATVGERKVEQRLKETVSENEALKKKLAAMEAEMEILRCKCEDCEDPLNKLLPGSVSVPQNEETPTVNV